MSLFVIGCDGEAGRAGPRGEQGIVGPQGPSGLNTIIVTSELTISDNSMDHCSNTGGQLISLGLDVNGNNALDEDEVMQEIPICNGVQGTSGLDTVVSVDPIPPGDSTFFCPQTGSVVSIGVDENGNGVLDIPEELDSGFVICNGVPGDSGPPGIQGPPGIPGPAGMTPRLLTEEIQIDPDSVEPCSATGGQKITIWFDRNNNNILDRPLEVETEFSICNGM